MLVLALGIGANAAMFGVVDRLLLSPPPHVAAAAALTRLHLEPKEPVFGLRVVPIASYPGYRAVRERARDAFVDVAAFFSTERVVGAPDEGAAGARPTRLVEATGNYFALLGARPALGRLFGPDDDRLPPGSRVAVLGDGYWRREFGGAADAVGKSIVVEGERYQVVGVVRNTILRELRETPVMQYYVPLAQQPGAGGGNLLVRAGGSRRSCSTSRRATRSSSAASPRRSCRRARGPARPRAPRHARHPARRAAHGDGGLGARHSARHGDGHGDRHGDGHGGRRDGSARVGPPRTGVFIAAPARASRPRRHARARPSAGSPPRTTARSLP